MDYSKMVVHSQIADMLKKDKVSTKEKELIYNAYYLLIREYIELEAKYEKLISRTETEEIKILN